MVAGGFVVPNFHCPAELPCKVLHQTRFLKIEEVVNALKFYEELIDTQ